LVAAANSRQKIAVNFFICIAIFNDLLSAISKMNPGNILFHPIAGGMVIESRAFAY